MNDSMYSKNVFKKFKEWPTAQWTDFKVFLRNMTSLSKVKDTRTTSQFVKKVKKTECGILKVTVMSFFVNLKHNY